MSISDCSPSDSGEVSDWSPKLTYNGDSDSDDFPECNMEETRIDIKGCLFNGTNPRFRYFVGEEFRQDRTYESPYKTYYMVLKPYKKYNKRKDISHSDNASIERKLRRTLKYKRILIIREINAESVHYNVLVTTKEDAYLLYDETNFNNYFRSHVQTVETVADVERVLNYMCKEADSRIMRQRDKFSFIND